MLRLFNATLAVDALLNDIGSIERCTLDAEQTRAAAVLQETGVRCPCALTKIYTERFAAGSLGMAFVRSSFGQTHMYPLVSGPQYVWPGLRY